MIDRSPIREFARLIYTSDGPFDVYQIHDRYQLGAAQILRLIRLFRRLGLVADLGEGVLEAAPGAKEFIWTNRYRLLLDGSRPWANAGFSRLDPATPYLPNLAKVDHAFFNSKVAEKDGQS